MAEGMRCNVYGKELSKNSASFDARVSSSRAILARSTESLSYGSWRAAGRNDHKYSSYLTTIHAVG